jgi:hypothetical protein
VGNQHAYNVLVMGPVGVGKTFLGNALAHIAVRRNHAVHTERADKLFKRLKAARLGATYENGQPFTIKNVTDRVQKLLEDDQLPEPDDNWPNVYAFIMPINSTFTTAGVVGQNTQVTWNDLDLGDVDNDPAYCLWVGNDATADFVTTVFSHELAELATDPNEGDGVRQIGCLGGSCQIGDPGTSWCDVVSGVKAQSYWSVADDALSYHGCIPFAALWQAKASPASFHGPQALTHGSPVSSEPISKTGANEEEPIVGHRLLGTLEEYAGGSTALPIVNAILAKIPDCSRGSGVPAALLSRNGREYAQVAVLRGPCRRTKLHTCGGAALRCSAVAIATDPRQRVVHLGVWRGRRRGHPRVHRRGDRQSDGGGVRQGRGHRAAPWGSDQLRQPDRTDRIRCLSRLLPGLHPGAGR